MSGWRRPKASNCADQCRALLGRARGHRRELGQLGLLELQGKDLAIAEDDREQIVEVVRDAAGELPDGIHALGLGRALLQLVLLGHVAADAIAGLVFLDPGHGPEHGDDGSVGPDMAIAHREQELACRPQAIVPDRQGAIVVMDEIEPGAADQFLAVASPRSEGSSR